MCRHERSGHLRFFRIACLFIGIIEATGALLWSVAGAGMYGSPLSSLLEMGSYKEFGFIVTIILAGPGLALWAGLCTGKLPCRAALMFFIGAALSVILGARYQDMGLLLAAFIFLPMCLAGLFALLVCRSDAQEMTNSTSSDAATSKQRWVQFGLLQLMLFIAALCTVFGLAFAHAEAARVRPLIRTPFLERLMNNKFVPAFTPLESGTALISRLHDRGGFSDGVTMWQANFTLDLPREQQLPLRQQIGRLRREFEDQLIVDGARILETTTSMGESDRSIDGVTELRINYRWSWIQGTLKTRLIKPNLVHVDIEESPVQSFLRLQW